jgi:hypothetical protein
MANLTNSNISLLLERFQPIFFFDPTEQFFPAVAEEVLAHESTESWNDLETHQRGSAVLLAPLTATSYDAADVQAGIDDPNGAPLSFNANPPTGIGQSFAYQYTQNDLFLDCAGWDDTASEAAPGAAAYTTGSIEYLQPLFSALGHAMNGAIPVNEPSPPPKFSFQPRSTSPTIYAELDWAGRYPVIDQQRVEKIGGVADFPSAIGPDSKGEPGPLSALNNYLTLTYFLFYPIMEPSPVAKPDLDAYRFREGQWEAVTVFLKGDPNFGLTDDQGRPDFSFAFVTESTAGQSLGISELRGLTPRFLAYSSGYGLGDDNFNPLAASVQPWPDATNQSTATTFGSHPFVYVTSGTHRNLYSLDATVTAGTSTPNPSLNTTGGALMGAAGSIAGICLPALLAAPAGGAGVVAYGICVAVAVVLFVIGLILFLLSLLFPSTTPQTETPQSTQPGTDVARDDGPAAIPSTPGVSIPTNASSTVEPALRLISEFSFDPTPPITDYPLPSPLPATGAIEMPSWWNFPGRWGVRVTPMASGEWDSGSRRTDPFGRTRAYWNAYQLVEFIAASGGTVSL